MPNRATAKAVLKLDDIHFVRGIRRAIDMAKALGKQFAANPIKTTFLAAALSANKAAGAFRGVAASIQAGAVKAFQVGVAGALAFGGAVATLSGFAIRAAANIETLETGFRVFLGTAAAAHKRMEDLASFSAATPFQLPDIAKASLELEVLTQGALSTQRGLTLVGDTASATNRSFEEMSVTIGRLYAGLRSGQNVGDTLRSLTDSGAISQDAARKIAARAPMDGAAAWKIAQHELARFSGMMVERSKTWDGLMSTFKDNVNLALAAFGAPIMDALKPQLDAAILIIQGLKPEIVDIGKKFGAAIKTGIDVLEGGLANPKGLMLALGDGLKVAFLEAGNVLVAVMKAAASTLTNPAFYLAFGNMLGQVLLAVTLEFSAGLMRAFEKPMAYFSAGIDAILSKLPVSLGGSGEKKRASALADQASKNAEDLRRRGLDAQFSGDTVRADKFMALADKQTQESVRQRKIASGDVSLERRVSEKMKNGEIGKAADKLSAYADANLKGAADNFSRVLSTFALSFKVEDVLGAGDAMKDFLGQVKSMAKQGETLAAAVKSNAEAKQHAEASRSLVANYTGAGIVNTWASAMGGPHIQGASMLGRDSRIFGPGIQASGNLTDGARRTVNSFLNVRERRSLAAQIRAAQSGEEYLHTGHFSVGGPGNVIRRGDRNAAMEYVRQKEKGSMEQSVEDIKTLIKQAWFGTGGSK